MSKVTDINDERIFRDVESHSDLTRDNSNIVEALEDCKKRSKVYKSWEDAKAEKLLKQGKEPYPCCNMVCEHYKQREYMVTLPSGEIKFQGRSDYCLTSDSHGCMFQMNDHPPNSLNYDEYMPTHIEALDMLETHNLLRGDRQRYIEENSTYNKPSSYGERNETEIKGISFSQMTEIILSLTQEIPEFFNPHSDNVALSQCLCVEIEKAMGIYPNIKLR